ncbi:glycerol acyltransferase [Bacteroidia bacterium]|nr:glycerol acyltransferase [Bacteroidia bacterium]
MLITEILDDYRPYYNEEINAAMQRIAHSAYFEALSAYVYPGCDPEEIKKQICAYTTIDEFQFEVMKAVNEQVIARSITHFSYSGLDKLDRAKRYMFISNHRDIMLDATLLQYALYLEGHQTSEITFGSNLMHPQEAVDIGKSNKMFKIIRGGTAREIFTNSLNVSSYMRYTLTEKHQSTWIAQRNGRTKDGMDKTEVAVLKMFAMSSKKPFAENLAELNITPIAVSYEYEPCDFLKTREIYLSRRHRYEKAPGEDLNSILHGITQSKGNTHFTFCETVTPAELAECAELPHSEQFKALAAIIDKNIYAGYKLWKTNYIAHDILGKKSEFSDKYSISDQEKFTLYMENGLEKIEGDKEELCEIFLGIYANPVNSKIKF